jgi:hypothetical protein
MFLYSTGFLFQHTRDIYCKNSLLEFCLDSVQKEHQVAQLVEALRWCHCRIPWYVIWDPSDDEGSCEDAVRWDAADLL